MSERGAPREVAPRRARAARVLLRRGLAPRGLPRGVPQRGARPLHPPALRGVDRRGTRGGDHLLAASAGEASAPPPAQRPAARGGPVRGSRRAHRAPLAEITEIPWRK